MQTVRDNRRIVLIILVAVLLLCLVAVLATRVFFTDPNVVVEGEPPPLPAGTEEVAVTTPEVGEEEVTPTPTRVISGEEATATPLPEPTEEEVAAAPTETPTVLPTPTAAAVSQSTGADFTVSSSDQEPAVVEVIQIDELLENPSFEEGFTATGVAEGWSSFSNQGAAINFSEETSDVYIKDGDYAQRISIDNVQEPDRYAGIYQTVEDLIPGESYTLTVHGQIRSPMGDIQASSYGYRVQYAVDQEGGTNWRDIPQEDWVEIPWEEQLIGSDTITFSKYMAPITASSEEITLFVRAWNKWTTPGLSEYTLDSLSLVGPVRTEQIVTGTTTAPAMAATTGDQMIDQSLPITGFDTGNLVGDGRFWGAVIVLSLLALGAVYRAKWRW